jgi:hypothetical protein
MTLPRRIKTVQSFLKQRRDALRTRAGDCYCTTARGRFLTYEGLALTPAERRVIDLVAARS